jgi:hypothetical protein
MNVKEDSNIIRLIDICLETQGSDYDIAKLIHTLYKDRFKFFCNKWYEYSNETNEWKSANIPTNLYILLSTEVCNKFMYRALYWSNETMKITDQVQRDIYNAKTKTLNEICVKLKNHNYIKKKINYMKIIFTVDKVI